jgi:hypothetical protein
MAGRHPEAWAAVSAWVPIYDLKAWYFESEKNGNRNYCQDIARSCGGVPGQSAEADEECRKRSPLTYLAKAKGLAVRIDAGIGDTLVPISHSLHAFNELADPKDRLSEDDIRLFVEKSAVPPHLKEPISDPSYGQNRPLFRRTSGKATVTIFQGGHELVPEAAMAWFQKLRADPEGEALTSRRHPSSMIPLGWRKWYLKEGRGVGGYLSWHGLSHRRRPMRRLPAASGPAAGGTSRTTANG